MELSKFKTVEQLAAAIKSLDMVTSVAWTNYYSDSTVTGLSSLTATEIYYKKIGKLVFVNFNLSGTNTASTITFTIKHSAATGGATRGILIRVRDSGTFQTTPGWASFAGSTVTCYKHANSGNFAGSGVATVQGHFWYEAA